MPGQKIILEFNDRVVRQFLLATLIWGIVGMLVGVLVAALLMPVNSLATLLIVTGGMRGAFGPR